VLTAHGEFWLEHNLTGVPDASFNSLASLEESYLVTSTATDIFKVECSLTMCSSERVELIVTGEVFDKTMELADQ
jgi:predicted transcriptional regulator